MRPNWSALATCELPGDEQASERLDIICDQLTCLLYRGHELADPELAEYFADRMMQAFSIQ